MEYEKIVPCGGAGWRGSTLSHTEGSELPMCVRLEATSKLRVAGSIPAEAPYGPVLHA